MRCVSRHHKRTTAGRNSATLLQSRAAKELDRKSLVLHFISQRATRANGNWIATASDEIQELATVIRKREALRGEQLPHEVFAESLGFFDVPKRRPASAGTLPRGMEHGELAFPLGVKE